jgi:nifR3 family TIM-barrel protein
MKDFWRQLKRPFFSLAPMYDVTDEAFRQQFVEYGRPDVLFTEFVSVDGLLSESGRPKIMRELYFRKNEHPIVAQVFGSEPAKFSAAAKLIRELGFDGLDINMGCPDKTIIKQGAGAGLIRHPALAQEIIQAAKDGAGDPTFPVSIKTRIGYSKPEEMENWLSAVLAVRPAHLTVHLRTMKEMSKVPAHWNLAGTAAALAHASGVLISANGDVKDLKEAREKAEEYGLDGVMIGRGAFGNPWIFTGSETDFSAKLRALRQHLRSYADLYLPGKTNDKLFGGHTKNFAIMKKHIAAYVRAYRGAVSLRAELLAAETPDEANLIISKHLARLDKDMATPLVSEKDDVSAMDVH